MKAIQLHDKYSEEIIGTVLLKDESHTDAVCEAWDEYQEHHNSNTEDEADIYEFVSSGNWDKCEVLDVDFYQPN